MDFIGILPTNHAGTISLLATNLTPKNSYISHRIIDNLPNILKKYKIKTWELQGAKDLGYQNW